MSTVTDISVARAKREQNKRIDENLIEVMQRRIDEHREALEAIDDFYGRK